MPRENFWLMAFPATLLFTHSLVHVLLPLLHPTLDSSSVTRKIALAVALALPTLWLAAQSFTLVDALIADGQWKLPAAQVQGIQAAKEIIPPGENVLILAQVPFTLKRETPEVQVGILGKP